MALPFPEHVAQAMRLAYAHLGERPRRIYAATEALKLGHGGIARVAAILGCHRRTIERGLAELRQPRPFPPDREHRKKGAAGRRACPSSRTSTGPS
jgi:hypothetical protein